MADESEPLPSIGVPTDDRTLATRPGIPSKAEKDTPTLAENLDRTDRHPVLIFGSSRSGKSAFIMSLRVALQVSPDIHVELGTPVLDLADPRCAEKHRIATRFYDLEAMRLDRGENLFSTQGDPFFIPIVIQPASAHLPVAKLAFLDGRGERYEPRHDDEFDIYKQFNDDVADLLRSFTSGITVIFVAPYSLEQGHQRDTRDSNFGLLGVMRGYRELRSLENRKRDRFLFLLSKWDQYAPPNGDWDLFVRPQSADVTRVIVERFAQSWGEFQSLPIGEKANLRKAFLQFSSGYYVNGEPREPPKLFKSGFQWYPKIVLNWLYRNALACVEGEMPSLRRKSLPALFPDIEQGQKIVTPVTEFLLKILVDR